jgi:hypothetical protein
VPHVPEKRDAPRDDTAAALEADIDKLLSEHTPAIQAIERALRASIEAVEPGLVEQVDFGNKLIAFGRSMRMRGLLFAIIAHKDWVNLQLADGAELPDPDGLIEGTGKRIRHVKVRSVEAASSPAVRSIVDAQVALRR